MKVAIFSNSKNLIKAAKETCLKLSCLYFNVWQETALDNLIKKMSTNLVLIDSKTFQLNPIDVITFLHKISQLSHVLIIENRDLKLNQDFLLAQLSKQCSIEELYFYQQFVVELCCNYTPQIPEPVQGKNITEKLKAITPIKEIYQYEDVDLSIINSKPTVRDYLIDSENFTYEMNNYENFLFKMEPICRKIYVYLKNHKNTPVSINNLCDYVWGIININKRKAIYVYIRKIRLFLNANFEHPEQLIKIGKGFYTLK